MLGPPFALSPILQRGDQALSEKIKFTKIPKLTKIPSSGARAQLLKHSVITILFLLTDYLIFH